MKTWHYQFPSHNLEGWALIILREDGFFAAVSDYGNYAYLWRSRGSADIREFFLNAASEWNYFARKLKPDTRVNAWESFKNVRREILKNRRGLGWDRDQARNVWEGLDEYEECGDWEGFLRDSEVSSFFDEPWELAHMELCGDVVNFCKKVLPRLAEQIKVELEHEKSAKIEEGSV